MRGFRFSLGNWKTQGRWPASWIIIAVTVGWYLIVESIFGRGPLGLVRSGAMAGTLVAHGQWFRLLSSIFVHLTIFHLFVNMISLWTLTVVESLLGTYFFVAVFFASGLLGNLLSLTFTPGNIVSAGASGAIFGLFGAMLGLAILRVLPSVVRNQLLFILVINVVLDVTHSSIDWLAHLGGMIAGILLTLIYTKINHRRSIWRFVALALALAAAVCLLISLFTPIPFGA